MAERERAPPAPPIEVVEIADSGELRKRTRGISPEKGNSIKGKEKRNHHFLPKKTHPPQKKTNRRKKYRVEKRETPPQVWGEENIWHRDSESFEKTPGRGKPRAKEGGVRCATS